jgi:hypothetical protein
MDATQFSSQNIPYTEVRIAIDRAITIDVRHQAFWNDPCRQ